MILEIAAGRSERRRGESHDRQALRRICHILTHGILTLAFNHLRKQPHTAQQKETASRPDGKQAPYDSDQHRVFNSLSIKMKLDMLKELFRQRSNDIDYLERFESDLQRFAEIEATCMPVLERFCLRPERVWLRELGGVLDALVQAVHDFDESLKAEHPDCPKFVDVVYNRR